MTITIDWATKVISIPKVDTQLVQSNPTEVRQLDLDAFRLTLRDIEDSVEGMPFLKTHNHNTSVDIGGVLLARVVLIINGYTLTFEDGQYAVNLIGANSNVGDNVNLNQVSIRSANSAGLTFSDQINDQSFMGVVSIDAVDGLPGTGFPRGTPTDPVLSYEDAHVIAVNRKLKTFNVSGDIFPSENISRYAFIGQSPTLGSVYIDGIISTQDTVFTRLTVTGAMNGDCYFHECAVTFVSGFQGAVYDSALIQNLIVAPFCDDSVRIVNCFSDIAGTERPTLDVNGSSCSISIRNYNGGLTISGMTANNAVSIDCNSATIELDASCTSANVVIRGIGYLIDNSGPGVTVSIDGLIEPNDVRLSKDHARAANQQTKI